MKISIRKLYFFSLLVIFLSIFTWESLPEELDFVWFDISRLEQHEDKYFSPDSKSFAVPIPWDRENTSGVYINMDGNHNFVPIPYLLGVGYIIWSEDQNFLFVDNGTYAIGSFVCINIDELMVIGHIRKLGAYYQITGNNVLITTADDGYRINGLLEKFSVYQYTIRNNTVIEEVLFESDELNDYYVIDYDGENLLIRRDIFEDTFIENPWGRFQKVAEEIIIFPLPPP